MRYGPKSQHVGAIASVSPLHRARVQPASNKSHAHSDWFFGKQRGLNWPWCHPYIRRRRPAAPRLARATLFETRAAASSMLVSAAVPPARPPPGPPARSPDRPLARPNTALTPWIARPLAVSRDGARSERGKLTRTLGVGCPLWREATRPLAKPTWRPLARPPARLHV